MCLSHALGYSSQDLPCPWPQTFVELQESHQQREELRAQVGCLPTAVCSLEPLSLCRWLLVA